MDQKVLMRFVKLLALATFVMFSFWMGWSYLQPGEPGDYHVRQGDIYLSSENYEDAIKSFDAALEASPDHRGALMGRAIAFMQLKRDKDAEAEFTYLIEYLTKNLQSDDPTGVGTLAAALANRGILYDRTGRYEKALADYIEAIKVDEGILKGPSLVDKIVYGTPDAATVRGRALYLKEQLALPESQRLLRVPEKDAEQRMHKP
ncbi:MAG: tetratricopeptide repeat protein [Paracoccaceae bacterium]|nr:tetratricopeptide repeat protein [Paracoccaceae bacterium]